MTVSVLPLKEEQDFNLDERDLEIKTQRGHGKGGQHQNKTDSAVRVKHIPTGITVFINGRDQFSNKRLAKQIIASRVAELQEAKIAAKRSSTKSKQVDGGGRGNKVRTYNFINNRVVDHRTGKKTGRIKDIMKGKLDLLK